MTFSDAIERSTSSRFYLVRVRPWRDVTATLSSAGSGVYTVSLAAPVLNVRRNGVALTRDTANDPPIFNDTWFHDDEDGVLKVKLGSAPNTSTNIIVPEYQLFFSSGDAGVVTHSPTDADEVPRTWEPRIDGEPTLRQNVGNVTEGIFTIDDGSVTLRNDDRSLNQWLSDDDSFYQKTIDIWLCVDSVSELQRVYQGKVGSVSLGGGALTLNFYDAFSRLNQPAYMGDESGEALFNRESTSFPSMNPAHHGKACPFIAGKFSPYRLRNPGNGKLKIDPATCYEAVCTDYDSSISTAVNRDWGLCRLPSAGIRTPVLTIGSKLSVSGGFDAGSTGGTIIVDWATATWNAATRDLEIGDLVRLTEGGVTAYGRLDEIIDFGSSIGISINGLWASAGLAATTSVVLTWLPDPPIFIQSGSTVFYPAPVQHYSYSVTSTSGGNKYLEISFTSNFESTVQGHTYSDDGTSYNSATLTTLDPATQKVTFRASVATSALNHADFLKSICLAAGLQCDDTTFDAAATALPVDARFTIPSVGETEYGPYLKYAQDVLRSTLGFVKHNSTTDEVEYYLIEAPSSTDEVDHSTYLEPGVSVDIEYQDIATEIIAHNPHLSQETNPDAFLTLSSNRARYLHGMTRTRTLHEHVLEDTTARLADILAIKSERRATYRFQTATKFLDGNVGDDCLLTSADLVGTSSRSLKIIGITKSTSAVDVEATDLGGI